MLFADDVYAYSSKKLIYGLQVLGHAVKVPKCCKEGSIMTDRGCIEDNMHLFSPTVNVLMHNSTHVNDEPVTAVDFETFVHNIDCAMGS